MKHIACRQGTPEWHAARCGKPTASRFADAVSTVGGLNEQQQKFVELVRAGTPKPAAAAHAGYSSVPSSSIIARALEGESTVRPSDTAERYAADLSIERISKSVLAEPARTWLLDRGHQMEDEARMKYEARTRAYVTEAGICLTDDGIFGYSSDGLVDDDGMIEVKAPVDGTKIISVWRDGDLSEYRHQMQGGMWITGRKWCDFIMYVPGLAAIGKDLYVQRVWRDDAFIDAMVLDLVRFAKMVETYEALLRTLGGPQAVPPQAAAAAPGAAPANDWRARFNSI